ncbi:MAG: formate dehydrogenase accessory sulfurtransferase FdhD [Spirochaetaceae bacterium]|nr:formate dehydrogenase accessory sulfurtransferase FdhD [Spirochaetaceae bacterium]
MSRSAWALAPEYPLEIQVNEKRIAVLMCTPYDLEELAIGYLFTRGMIKSLDDVLTIGLCPDRSRIKIEVAGGIEPDSLGLGDVVASGCGSGLVLSQAFLARPPLPDGWTIELRKLTMWTRTMFDAAELYKATGGLHCAALASEAGAERTDDAPGLWVVREDVGRHNAIDKAIGRGLLDGADFARSCLLTSGRIAADMALKAIGAGVPIVASRSIPTTSAYEIAVKSELTLVGRIGSSDPTVYTRPERIR